MIDCIYQNETDRVCLNHMAAGCGYVCDTPSHCTYQILPCVNKYIKNTAEACDNCGQSPLMQCYDWKSSTTESDAVDHPSHYCQGEIECIKAIEASMTPEEFHGYCKGNVIKYIWRFREKNGLEDLKKAQVYLGWMIESKEKQEESK